MLAGKKILIIIGGGVAAYKTLSVIRDLRRKGAEVTAVLTKAGQEFVTPLSVAALTGNKAYTDLFDLNDEAEMGHIELSRAADLLVVAPASADLLAKMAHGLANDLASTLLLATDKRVLVAPSMNVRMWQHPATQRNLATLVQDGVLVVGPDDGDMACGEFGPGRLAEPDAIIAATEQALGQAVPQALSRELPQELPRGPLHGKHILVTSGPTHEPIDPVRYIANRSSGKQGTAIATALVALGAEVTFVTGPATAARPIGANITEVETAREMHDAVTAALPADAAVFAAAVADWRMAHQTNSKIKKDDKGGLPQLKFRENPDILAHVSQLEQGRPPLVVGFAAETDNVLENARAKRARKGCDWILANDVSPETGIMGGGENAVVLIKEGGDEAWPRMDKDAVAGRLAQEIAAALGDLGDLGDLGA